MQEEILRAHALMMQAASGAILVLLAQLGLNVLWTL